MGHSTPGPLVPNLKTLGGRSSQVKKSPKGGRRWRPVFGAFLPSPDCPGASGAASRLEDSAGVRLWAAEGSAQRPWASAFLSWSKRKILGRLCKLAQTPQNPLSAPRSPMPRRNHTCPSQTSTQPYALHLSQSLGDPRKLTHPAKGKARRQGVGSKHQIPVSDPLRPKRAYRAHSGPPRPVVTARQVPLPPKGSTERAGESRVGGRVRRLPP